MRRREFLVGLAGASALARSRAASAQASSTVPLIGMLAPLSPALAAHQIRAFRSELRELGYVEGRNVELDIRYAEGATARIPQLAAELIARKPAVLLAFSTAAVQAASAATKTIPLVIATLEDPVAQGLVKSIARPGTNVTGTWMAGDEGMIGKRGFALRRKPASYHVEKIRKMPDGHFFEVITKGFGTMFPYGSRILPHDRWAIVAYVRALQESQDPELAGGAGGQGAVSHE